MTSTGRGALLLATVLYCPLMANYTMQLQHVPCTSMITSKFMVTRIHVFGLKVPVEMKCNIRLKMRFEVTL